MHIEQLDFADAGSMHACHAVFLAGQQVDEPWEPPFGERMFGCWLTTGWGGEPREIWLVRGQVEGTVAGWYRLELPDLENLDRAGLSLFVAPEERRRGLGRALLKHAAGRAAAHGRTVLGAGVRNGTAGEAFARSVGAESGLVEVERVLEVGPLGDGRLARLREQAEQHAAGYDLVTWTGPVPEEFIEPIAALYAAMNDAPHDPDDAPEKWDAQRVRERVNELRRDYGARDYSVAACYGATGEMAALTQVSVDPDDPDWGFQLITAVTAKHRGHRLGLLVKVAMLEWLATAEPGLERIVTWNAQVNQHMIGVNEALGYTILGSTVSSWRLDVAAVLAIGV